MCLGPSIKNQPSGARHGLSLALGTFVFLLIACVSPIKLGAAEVVRWGDSAFGMDIVPAGATDVIAAAERGELQNRLRVLGAPLLRPVDEPRRFLPNWLQAQRAESAR